MKRIWIVLLLVVVASIATLYYLYINNSPKADPFTVIPSNSILVVEVNNPEELRGELREKKFTGILKSTLLGKQLSDHFRFFDSLSGNDGSFSTYNSPFIFSLHRSGSNFDFIFYLTLHTSYQESDFEKIWKKMESEGRNKIEKREVNGFTITSISSGEKSGKVYFTRYQGILIGSFSEVLVEDVIAKIRSSNEIPFWKNEKVKKNQDLGGKATIYLNYQQLPSFLSAYSDDPLYKKLSSFASESVLDLKLSEGQMFLNGYSYSSGSDFLDVFKGQQPQDFLVRNYLPLNTQSVYYLGFDKPEKLCNDFTRYLKKQDPDILALRDSLSGKDSTKVLDVFKILRSEIAICSVGDTLLEKLVFLRTVDPEELLKNLIAFSGEDSLSGSSYSGKLSDKNITEALFGRMFKGLDETWYMLLDDYVVLSGSMAALQHLEESLTNENVWGKTLLFSSLLDENLTHLNVGFLINTAILESESLTNVLPRQVEMVTLQFSNLGGPCLTGITVNYEEQEDRIPEREQTEKSLVFDSPILQSIIPENGTGLFVKDSSHLHYVSEKGEIEWEYSLNGSVTSVYAADIDKDKEQDFIFASGNRIYTLDKNGKGLEKYSFTLHDTLVIEHFSLLDYDGDKNYRLVIADRNGHIYFFDRDGKNLEGWTPKALSGSLIDKVRHMRLQGKVYILAAGRNGIVHLLNRRGEEMENFPVRLGTSLNQGILVRKGPGSDKTYILTGAVNGDVYYINLNGKLVRREKFIQPFLLRDERGSGSILIRKIGTNLEIMNLDGDKEFMHPSNENFASISLYKTPTNKDLIVLWNQVYYQILGNEGFIAADGRGKNIQSIRLFIHERKKEGMIFIISPDEIEIRDFTY